MANDFNSTFLGGADPDDLRNIVLQLSNRLNALEKAFLEVDSIDEISGDMGEMRGGAFITGTGDPFDNTNDPYTGVAIVEPGIDPDGSGTTYELIGMNAGVLEVGIDNTGKLLAGGGAVTIDSTGIDIANGSVKLDANGMSIPVPEGAIDNLKSIKYTIGSDVSFILSEFKDITSTFTAYIYEQFFRRPTTPNLEYYKIFNSDDPTGDPHGEYQVNIYKPTDDGVGSRADMNFSVAAFSGQQASVELSADSDTDTSQVLISANIIDLIADTLTKNSINILTADSGTCILVGNGNLTTIAAGATALYGFGLTGTLAGNSARTVITPSMNILAFKLRWTTAQPGTGTLVWSILDASGNNYASYTVPAGGAAGNATGTINIANIPNSAALLVSIKNNASSASAQIANFSITLSPVA